MPDEPPTSEVNVDLVDESDVLAASSDFDQGHFPLIYFK